MAPSPEPRPLTISYFAWVAGFRSTQRLKRNDDLIDIDPFFCVLLRDMGEEFRLTWWEEVTTFTHEDSRVFCKKKKQNKLFHLHINTVITSKEKYWRLAFQAITSLQQCPSWKHLHARQHTSHFRWPQVPGSSFFSISSPQSLGQCLMWASLSPKSTQQPGFQY